MANSLTNSSEDCIQHFTHASCNNTLLVHAANDEHFLLPDYDEFSKKFTQQKRRKWNARQALAARGIAYQSTPAHEESSLIKPLRTQNTCPLQLTNT